MLSLEQVLHRVDQGPARLRGDGSPMKRLPGPQMEHVANHRFMCSCFLARADWSVVDTAVANECGARREREREGDRQTDID